MSIIKSLLLGNEGTYKILGVQLEFQKELPSYLSPPSLEGHGIFSKLASKFINSDFARLISVSNIHLFVHEMSHAIACKLITNQNSSISFFTKRCLAVNYYPREVLHCQDWKRTILDSAGPIGDIAFSSCQLVAANALKNYISWPISLLLGGGALLFMAAELFYAYSSASKKDFGDFGLIAKRNISHLVFSSIALISSCALGIFGALKFPR